MDFPPDTAVPIVARSQACRLARSGNRAAIIAKLQDIYSPTCNDYTNIFGTPSVPGAAPAGMENSTLVIRGAREHNLQNVNLELPRNRLIVFTGVSGSGTSSLAFDTLYA